MLLVYCLVKEQRLFRPQIHHTPLETLYRSWAMPKLSGAQLLIDQGKTLFCLLSPWEPSHLHTLSDRGHYATKISRRLPSHGIFTHHSLSLGLAILWQHGPCPHQHESHTHWPYTLRTATYQSRSYISLSWYTTHWPITPLIFLTHDYSGLLLSYYKLRYRQNKLPQISK